MFMGPSILCQSLSKALAKQTWIRWFLSPSSHRVLPRHCCQSALRHLDRLTHEVHKRAPSPLSPNHLCDWKHGRSGCCSTPGPQHIPLCGNLPGLLWVILRAPQANFGSWDCSTIITNFWNSQAVFLHTATPPYLPSLGKLRLNLRGNSSDNSTSRKPFPIAWSWVEHPWVHFLSRQWYPCYSPYVELLSISSLDWTPWERVVHLIHVHIPSAWHIPSAP